jgi:hypothetical protein
MSLKKNCFLYSGNAEETSRRWILSSLKIVTGLRRMFPLLLVRTKFGVNGCKFIIYKFLIFRLCVLYSNRIFFISFRMRQQNTFGNGKGPSLATEKDNRDRHRDSSSTGITATGTQTCHQRGSPRPALRLVINVDHLFLLLVICFC